MSNCAWFSFFRFVLNFVWPVSKSVQIWRLSNSYQGFENSNFLISFWVLQVHGGYNYFLKKILTSISCTYRSNLTMFLNIGCRWRKKAGASRHRENSRSPGLAPTTTSTIGENWSRAITQLVLGGSFTKWPRFFTHKMENHFLYEQDENSS